MYRSLLATATMLGVASLGLMALSNPSRATHVAQAPAPIAASSSAASRLSAIPRYDHIIVIVEENKSYAQIIGSEHAPRLTALAEQYGSATRFYGEVHPSEGNYVAMIAGDTFGIHDDDAWFCLPNVARVFCSHNGDGGYVPHTIDAPTLVSQLEARHKTWRGYFEDIPTDWRAIVSAANVTRAEGLYAAKHNPFVNIASIVRNDRSGDRIVGFDALERDLKLPQTAFSTFAMVVPNQCNEMHGLRGKNVPDDCEGSEHVIERGDAYTAKLIAQIQASPVWRGPGRTAIVVTWDEDSGFSQGDQGCCGWQPGSLANFGGGHIATIVLNNHGVRGVRDDTPHNHYSLLRTMEDAFGIDEHLRHANDADVQPMSRLFADAR